MSNSRVGIGAAGQGVEATAQVAQEGGVVLRRVGPGQQGTRSAGGVPGSGGPVRKGGIVAKAKLGGGLAGMHVQGGLGVQGTRGASSGGVEQPEL